MITPLGEKLRERTNAGWKKRKSNLVSQELWDREQYLRHIRRLEARNRLLSDMLVEERSLRLRAYKWYQARLESRFWSVLYMITNCFDKDFDIFKYKD